MIAVVLTDGRPCVDAAVASLAANVKGIDRIVLSDDSGDEGHRRRLAERHRGVAEVVGLGARRGYDRAVAAAWRIVAQHRQPYAFVTEDDFTYDRPVDVAELVALLEARPYLQQVALRRQAWFPAEIDAGGVLERFPAHQYVQCHDPYADRWWIEHRLFWTQNPHVLSAETARRWPPGAHSEHRFAARAFTDPAHRAAYWGRIDEAPWVTHVGDQRRGTRY